MDDFRVLLRELVGALRVSGAISAAAHVERALAGSDAEAEAFLRSNELWGGSGSIADQGFIEGPREARRRGARVLVELGNLQMERGVANVRTGMWVGVFEKWLRDGVA